LQAVTDAISQFLVDENVSVFDTQVIQENTKGSIINLLEQSLDEGWGITKLKEGIDSLGVFSAERALTISRTLNGTARSIGQITAAKKSGAKFKKWESAEDKLVRKEHAQRNSAKPIPIDETWNNGIKPMRFPNDPKGDVSDRVNCRCAMSFE